MGSVRPKPQSSIRRTLSTCSRTGCCASCRRPPAGSQPERLAENQPHCPCHSRSRRTAGTIAGFDFRSRARRTRRDFTGRSRRPTIQFHCLRACGRPGKPQMVKVSRTVARQVLEQGIAILGTDVPSSGDLRAGESLVASQVRSLLCVPLTVFQRVIGCIYLDSNSWAAGCTKNICNW